MFLQSHGFIENVYGNMDNIIKTYQKSSLEAVVITPTTGGPYLRKAMESVSSQSFNSILHLLIVDGSQFIDDVLTVIKNYDNDNLKIITLPFNTGRNGINGHRIYAAFPLLLNSDYIFFLDEDNWWDDDHVRSMIHLLETENLDWAFSMRKFYTQNEVFVANDNCESIGNYEPYSNFIKGWPSYVDTNCYGFRRNTIAQTSHFWFHPLRADRYFFHQARKMFPNYASTKKFTVNYRLKENGPVSPQYVIEGNQHMLHKYNSKLPWL